MSQLDLALLASTTPRHVSFVETGRSRPGRDLVLRFSEALGLDLREQNTLLTAAGLATAYPERPYDDDAMSPVRRVIEQVLSNHEPYPGLLFGPDHVVMAQNEACRRWFPGIASMAPDEIARTWFVGAPPDTLSPVLTPTLRFGGTHVRTITTVLRFDRPMDVTTAELHVELIFPADTAAERFFRQGP